MKKLLLTTCTAALFSVAVMAQDRPDTTQRERNQYRTTRPLPKNQSTTDSSSNQYIKDRKNAGQNLNDSTQEVRDTLQQRMDNGNNYQRPRQQAGGQTERSPEQSAQNFREGEEPTKKDIEQSTKKTDAAIKNNDDTTGVQNDQTAEIPKGIDNGNASMMNQSGQQQSTIEVVEGKEGPENQVVYRYQGELYYIDRNTQQLVKANESQLKDSKSSVKVIEGPQNSDNAKNTHSGTKKHARSKS
jgi:hypothetical protein